jgi:hypothetical protein
VVKLARERKIPVFYIQVEDEKQQFHQEFIQKSGAFTNTLISSRPESWFEKLIRISIEQLTKISDILPDLKRAATMLKEETGKRPILIIDAYNRLADQDYETLKQLQRLAKDEADMKRLLIVFVSSEGLAPKTLFSRSDSSHMIL